MGPFRASASAQLTAAKEAGIDLPGYTELYYRWEREGWEAGEIDLAEDRREWEDDLSGEVKRSLLWVLAWSAAAGDRVTRALVPFVDAAPTEEQQVLLTTQLADAARHSVFFGRFHAEVVGGSGAGVASHPLLELLSDVSRRIGEVRDRETFVEGVCLYHIVVKGMLAPTGRRLLSTFAHERGVLPGLREGLTAVGRDDARHTAFGVRFLAETIEAGAPGADAVHAALDRIVPIGMSALAPAEGNQSLFDPDDVGARAHAALSECLRAVGIADRSRGRAPTG